jgi:transcriptional regulator GlxA family with amidase domain
VIIAILLYPGLTALDAIGPYEVLNSAEGFDIRFVWKKSGPVVTDHGAFTLGATHGFDEVGQPDVLIVPGSSANTGHAMRDEAVLAYVRSVHEHTRWTTSVCSGALVLAAAGILKGHPATTHWAVMSSLARFGAEPRPQMRVVTSGKVITAAGVSAGIDMGLALLAELKGAQVAKAVQLAIEYDPQPPFDTGHTTKADANTLAFAKQRLQARGSAPQPWE